jgi:DNA polymerase
MTDSDRLATLLDQSGLPVWRLRDYRGALPAGAQRPAAAPVVSAPASAASAQAPVQPERAAFEPRPVGVTSATNPPTLAKQSPITGPAAQTPVSEAPPGDWASLETEIRACQACGLCRQRKQAVPGVGDRRAEWLFIGEGPGAEEDERGEPFVGQAGRLLDAMLASIGLDRTQGVYIANAVKCRPPGNRTPEAGEMAACKPFLERQIALIQPKLIVLLGRAAAHSVLGSDDTLSALRGRTMAVAGVPVVVTYHPAYLLRTPLDKAKAWEDLCRARAILKVPDR